VAVLPVVSRVMLMMFTVV